MVLSVVCLFVAWTVRLVSLAGALALILVLAVIRLVVLTMVRFVTTYTLLLTIPTGASALDDTMR